MSAQNFEVILNVIYRLSGKIENIVVRQLSKFRIDRLNIGLNNGYQVGLDITFPYVEVNGKYDIDGVVGDMFQIYGNGPFWYVFKTAKYTKINQHR